MSNAIKRIELPFNSSNLAVENAVNIELAIIDGLGGTVTKYKEGYSSGMDKLIINIEYNSFNPLNFNPYNYWDSENMTDIGGIITAKDYKLEHDLSAPLVVNSPTKIPLDIDFNGIDSYLFDGIDDYLYKSVANWRNLDIKGEMITVVKPIATKFSIGLSTSDEASNNDYISLLGATVDRWGRIMDGGTNYKIQTNPIENYSLKGSTLFVFSSSGVVFRLFENNIEKIVQMGSGANNGIWLSSIGNRDNISIGARIKNTNNYGNFKWVATGYFPYLTDINRLSLINGLISKYGL